MLPPDRAQSFANAPIEDLLYVLLRQLKRPLDTQHVVLTDAQARALAAEQAGGGKPDVAALIPALVTIVAESEAVLKDMGLAFIASLDTPMDEIPGWESTADFIEIANEKANAELRITLGAALTLVFGGERRFAPYLLHLAAGDYGDESMIARRALLFAADIPDDAPDALERARQIYLSQ